MGIGPLLIFDKSSIQSLTVDESVWLDAHYKGIITPLFFVETLADLSKEMKSGRTPEDVVGNIAEKVSIGGPPNIHHSTLCLAELHGNKIEMSRRPVVGGGRQVTSGKRQGIVFEQAPEIDALQRWQNRDFLEVERRFASRWRQSLLDIDLNAIFEQGREIIKRTRRPKDLAEAKELAVQLINKPNSRYAKEAVKASLPGDQINPLMKRWQEAGNPPLSQYAPYTAHLATVDLFFCIALGADLIGRERPSNKIDLAYLYYLPFCMAFTSRDNLHIRTVPLFLKEDQIFIHGGDLKADLAKLDVHYSQLSDEVKETGTISFAHIPPKDGDFLTSKVWDQLMAPRWREDTDPNIASMSEEDKKEIIEEINKISKLKVSSDTYCKVNSDEVDHLLVQFKSPIFKGKWRLLPPSVEQGIKD